MGLQHRRSLWQRLTTVGARKSLRTSSSCCYHLVSGLRSFLSAAHIRTSKNGGPTLVTISDTGKGI